MKKWDNSEDNFLKNNYDKMTAQQVGGILNRSLGSVRRRMKTLQLKKLNKVRENLIGQKFGLLTIVSLHSVHGGSTYLCSCDCGNHKIIEYSNLTCGITKSCGCIRYKELEATQYKAAYNMYSYSAKKRTLVFDLTFEEFMLLVHQNCNYCGSEPIERLVRSDLKEMPEAKGRIIFINGIDRIDNDIGYTPQNSVPCCKTCNWMKTDMTKDDFLSHIEKISHHRNYV